MFLGIRGVLVCKSAKKFALSDFLYIVKMLLSFLTASELSIIGLELLT